MNIKFYANCMRRSLPLITLSDGVNWLMQRAFHKNYGSPQCR
ncbi:hypothetical protein SXCC_00719 [Gluconacetobacter sp. SXCC-1]|nr:hypothetical protein SXCC_00719 [Gluconacetobacter sp. SXCC-1]